MKKLSPDRVSLLELAKKKLLTPEVFRSALTVLRMVVRIAKAWDDVVAFFDRFQI